MVIAESRRLGRTLRLLESFTNAIMEINCQTAAIDTIVRQYRDSAKDATDWIRDRLKPFVKERYRKATEAGDTIEAEDLREILDDIESFTD